MNILFLNLNSSNACSFYRSAGIVNDLQRKTNDIISVAQWGYIDMNWSTILQYDLIMFQRPSSKAAFELCEYIKSCNKKLWVDYDDNLLCVPPENKAHWTYDQPEVKDYIKKIIALSDVVTVTTEDLKQSFLPFNKNIEVIPNAFNDILFHRGILPKRSNLIAWRGTDTHIWDLMSYGKAIGKATAEFPEKQFLYIGYYPWFMEKSLNQCILPELDLILYFKDLYKMNPLCFHVPLVDELFNRCKSNIAFIEGSYFGAVCIVPEFWDVPGTLKYSKPQEYYEALKTVLSGEVDVEKMNSEAWEFIMDELALSKVNIKRLQIINSLI